MPRSPLGQLITFATSVDEDQKFSAYIWVDVKHGDTVQKIAARRGHPEQARTIADLNDIRSVRSVLGRTRIRVPGTLRQSAGFHVLAGDDAPSIVAGYAKFEVVDRDSRTGLTHFTGYDPVTMSVPIRFEAFKDGAGADIERDIAILERMAGRGNFEGSSIGPPAVIRVTTTDNTGQVVPLIPKNYQWSPQNPSGPSWRVAGIDWEAGPSRNRAGNRIRQLATVTCQQHVSATLAVRSVTARSKAKRTKR